MRRVERNDDRIAATANDFCLSLGELNQLSTRSLRAYEAYIDGLTDARHRANLPEVNCRFCASRRPSCRSSRATRSRR
jgi:hypothetical protein